MKFLYFYPSSFLLHSGVHAHQVVSDDIESVDVAGPLSIGRGEGGGESSKYVAKQHHSPQHGHHRHPLLRRQQWYNVSVTTLKQTKGTKIQRQPFL